MTPSLSKAMQPYSERRPAPPPFPTWAMYEAVYVGGKLIGPAG